MNGAWTIINTLHPDDVKDFHMDVLVMTDYLWSTEGVMNFDIDAMNKFAVEHNMTMWSLHDFKIGDYKLNAKRYPYKRVVDYFGTNYFTDTITYMIALALYQNTYLARGENGIVRPELKQPLKLLLFGVDMSTTLEYAVSKGGIEFWLGQARTMGVEVFVSFGSVVLAHPRGIPYGWHYKIDKNMIDPENIMGDEARRKKKGRTGSEKIQMMIRGGVHEEMYQSTGDTASGW